MRKICLGISCAYIITSEMTTILQKRLSFHKSIIHYIFIKTLVRQIIINLLVTVGELHYAISVYNGLWELHPVAKFYNILETL